MIVTLLTDFGTADYFVGAMKGVILGNRPHVPVVDITHEIPPQDIHTAAFTLLAVYRTFPAGTIHVAVVDPGVGSVRRPILVHAGGQFFVGPDNGLFSYIFDRETDARVYHLTNARFFRQPVSTTFHGRDIFAPVAGALAASVAPSELGSEVSDPVRFAPLQVERVDEHTLQGAILHVDHFGNCITNFAQEDLPEEVLARGFRLVVNGHEIRSLCRYFAEEGAAADELFAIWGSAGFLEVAANRDSAAQRLGAARGQPVTVHLE